jgi:RAD51-like protein 2
LIVLDSVSFHFRRGFSDMALRARLLAETAQTLHRAAVEHSAAVVAVNQMTTKMAADARTGERRASMVPALGETWAHACTNRLLLTARGDQRIARLDKSPSRPRGEAPYLITASGLRGPPLSQKRRHSGAHGDTEATEKRQRG